MHLTNRKDMEWSNETVLEFLYLFENEPVIWNTSLANHKNRDDVFDSWKRIEIAMKHKYSISELKKKKDSLMASYRTCVRKVKDSSKSGAGADEVYKPNWFAFSIIDRFLRGKNQPRETISSETGVARNTEQLEGMPDPNTTQNVPRNNDTETQLENEAVILPTRSSTPLRAPSRKRKTPDDSEMRKKIDDAYNVLKTKTQPSAEKHICDIYGELVAAKLKALDVESREICMHRMDNVLFEMRKPKLPPITSSPIQTVLFQNEVTAPSTPDGSTTLLHQSVDESDQLSESILVVYEGDTFL